MGKKRIPEEVFHVEVITKARLSKRGVWEYLVKWAGYDSDADTWEPEGNVAGCQRLLSSFWKHVGMDDLDHPVGYQVEAEPKWIKKEKHYFIREFSQAQEDLKLKREKEEQAKKEKERAKKLHEQAKKTKKAITEDIESSFPMPKGKGKAKDNEQLVESSDSEGNQPLLKIKIPTKRPRVSSDDDTPLLQVPARKIQKTDSNDASGSKANGAADKGKEKAREQAQTPSGYNPPTPLFSEGSSPPISLVPNLSPAPLSPTRSKAASTSTIALNQVRPNNTVTASSFSNPSRSKPLPSKASSASNVAGRQTNTHVKVLEMSPQSIPTSSGLSTKQRIAQGALAPTNPKTGPLPLPKLSVPLPGKTNSGLMALSFKKKPSLSNASGSGSGNGQMEEDVKPRDPRLREGQASFSSLNAAAALQSSPKISPTTSLFSDVPHVVASPISIHGTLDQTPYFENFDPYPETISPMMLLQHHEDDLMAQADDFLSSIMPSELAAPLIPSMEEDNGPVPPRPLVVSIPAALKSAAYKIPKKWKWSGQIFMDVTGSKSELLCDATLTDPTDHLPNGLRLSMVITPVTSIRLSGFYDMVDLDMFLLACKPVEQLARLGPQGEKDMDALRTLASYMGKKQQVLLVPLSLDDAVAAFLLLFPPALGDLCRRFDVSSSLQQNGSLVAALIPWRLSPMYQTYEWRKRFSTHHLADETIFKPTLDAGRWSRSLRVKSHYHHALRILQFPKWLHDYMSQPNRAYCVWWESGDGTKKDQGLETTLLFSIMEQCRAKNVGHKADVRAVFVHVGALRSLHKLPALVERRSKRPEVNFYTYGTHESVPSERWGIHEIFPIGGIVTFTPTALVEDPIGVFHRITQLAKHPLWACYILPSVLGMVAKLTSNGEDPLSTFDKGHFPHHYLLTAIEEGEVALVHAPPHRRNPLGEDDPMRDWVRHYFTSIPMQSRAILEDCIKVFNEQYTNVQKSEWSSVIESEISNDLSSMQMQPAIMENYRRFVVIKAAHDNHIGWNKDGFEWVPLSNFDFKDDFFPKQTPMAQPEELEPVLETSATDVRS